MNKKNLSKLAKIVLDEYLVTARGGSLRYLGDSVKRAFVASAAFHVMLQRYEFEEEKLVHTSPNDYVDAIREVEKLLEL